jgi:type I restriction enzyme R subunit
MLYEHPFTAHASHGPEDLFPEPDVDAMVAVLDRVRANANANATATDVA